MVVIYYVNSPTEADVRKYIHEMANFFTQYRGELNLAKQVATPNQGFRPGQLGAMHAVLAHESVHEDPAIVCLPRRRRERHRRVHSQRRSCPPQNE